MPETSLVIVESPAKAKTIEKYLGPGFTVLASYGHVRDLPPKDGSVRPDEDFAMDWELGDRSRRHVDALAKAAKGADTIYLATDPDREGEAISWHVQELLEAERGIRPDAFRRVTFNEITRGAVSEAMENPREVNDSLVQAYLARRALDYLVGFTLSPVLWRKLPGSRSAGRVQSVALRLICEREAEIEAFRPQEYWTIEVTFATMDGQSFTARLTHLDGKKLDKFALGDGDTARKVAERLTGLDYSVQSVERRQVRRNPSPPFTTSTLQQEASRKLGLSASQTMRTAQRLYEGVDIGGETVGLITYMRTDGLQIAAEALDRARGAIQQDYGPHYLPDSPRLYKSKAKNAQEAHEAIRPTDPARKPASVAPYLSRDELRLYELIWKRTLASQMASAVLNQVAVDISEPGGQAVLRATGSTIRFDGFLKVYEEGRDDRGEAEDDANRRLPALEERQRLEERAVKPDQHFTQPPPRFTEASLVKRLEELGIGRPSTYASIIQVLQDREYVRLESKRFYPEDRGRLVTTFLVSFFGRYVEYDFTARLEDQLDEISAGKADWKEVLRQFWEAFSAAVAETSELRQTHIIDALDAELGPHFFPPRADGADPRLCPACGSGRLGLKLARRSGAFIGCSNYPDCTYTRPLEAPDADGTAPTVVFPRQLGEDPESGLSVTVRQGPFGHYIQLGPAEGSEEKPKRASLPKNISPAEVDLDTALKLLALPRLVGLHPEDGEEITAGIGRYGPYLRHKGAYKSLPAGDDVLSIGMNRAVELLATAKKAPTSEPIRELGTPEGDTAAVAIFNGRYGPYVRQGRSKVMASIPKGVDPEKITLEEAVALLEAKAAKAGAKARTARKPAAKTAAKKTTAKTTSAKKAPAKKASAKKASAASAKKTTSKAAPKTAAE